MDWLGEVLQKLNWGVSSTMVTFVPADLNNKLLKHNFLTFTSLFVNYQSPTVYIDMDYNSVRFFCPLSPEINENSHQSVIYTTFKMICLYLTLFCGGNDSGGNYILNVFEKE